ncbi:hypothetical protein MXA17_001667 [Escherichia coli]|nr:hypothetical protein [Escherichia coli]
MVQLVHLARCVSF